MSKMHWRSPRSVRPSFAGNCVVVNTAIFSFCAWLPRPCRSALRGRFTLSVGVYVDKLVHACGEVSGSDCIHTCLFVFQRRRATSRANKGSLASNSLSPRSLYLRGSEGDGRTWHSRIIACRSSLVNDKVVSLRAPLRRRRSTPTGDIVAHRFSRFDTTCSSILLQI